MYIIEHWRPFKKIRYIYYYTPTSVIWTYERSRAGFYNAAELSSLFKHRDLQGLNSLFDSLKAVKVL